MKKHLVTYKFLLKPTKKQQTLIKKSIDSARFLYNQLKSTKEVAYSSYGVTFSKFDLSALLPSLKEKYSFLKKNIHSQVAQDVNQRLDNAFQKFFSGAGYPDWAKKYKYNSITYPQNCKLIEKGVLKLP